MEFGLRLMKISVGLLTMAEALGFGKINGYLTLSSLSDVCLGIIPQGQEEFPVSISSQAYLVEKDISKPPAFMDANRVLNLQWGFNISSNQLPVG